MAKFVPKKFEKEVVTVRMSSDLLETVDQKAAVTGISRNQFLIQCIEYALANMEDEEPEA